ncbi:hypothetical protein MOP88_20210, partial [Sphingomonas sp. WKB10]|nr:hypothetical protein [Sphingomonas sp. WKB10]
VVAGKCRNAACYSRPEWFSLWMWQMIGRVLAASAAARHSGFQLVEGFPPLGDEQHLPFGPNNPIDRFSGLSCPGVRLIYKYLHWSGS